MSLIDIVQKEEATGKVAEIYESMTNAMGYVPNAFSLFSSSPHLLEVQYGNLKHFMRHKTLGGKFLALVRYLVSDQEECTYCVGMNRGILMHYGVLPDQLAEIKANPAISPLEENELQLLLFVLKVVKNAASVEQADMDALRKLGWTDADILEASYHATSQIGVDRLFNAFKLESDR
ncbi:MAG: hypothetical protein IPH88_03550 [Bacteroidales bacterium]|nr:hypothetical protein [Bacteroidales bacterium]